MRTRGLSITHVPEHPTHTTHTLYACAHAASPSHTYPNTQHTPRGRREEPQELHPPHTSHTRCQTFNSQVLFNGGMSGAGIKRGKRVREEEAREENRPKY